jgi:hypothetical protein
MRGNLGGVGFPKGATVETERTAEVVEQGRVKYFHDEEDEECLAINVAGLSVDRGETLWIWGHKPKSIGALPLIAHRATQ